MQEDNDTDMENFHRQVMQRILNGPPNPRREENLNRFERVVDHLDDLSDYHMMKKDDGPPTDDPVGTQGSSSQVATRMPPRNAVLRNRNEFANPNSRDPAIGQREFRRPEAFNRESPSHEYFSRESPNRESSNQEYFPRESPNREYFPWESPSHEYFSRESPNRESFNRESFNRESFHRESSNRESSNRESSNRESFDNTPRFRSRNSQSTSSRDGRQYEQNGFGRSTSRDPTIGFVQPNQFQQGPSDNSRNFRPRNSPSTSNAGSRWNRNEDFNALRALPETDKVDRIRKACMNGFGFGTDRRDTENNRNYGFRSRANKPRELTSQDKEYYNKNVRDLRDTLENLHEHPNYMERAAAKDPKLAELVDYFRVNRGIEEEDDSVKLMDNYANEISAHRTIKYFDTSKGGYVRINEKRTREEQEIADVSTLEILHFVYCKNPDYAGRLVELERRKNVVEKTDNLIVENRWDIIMPEDYSMITDFSTYSDSNCPQHLLARNSRPRHIMLRPVIIDGMAIQYISSGKKFRPFYSCKNSENMMYDPDLVINVRPVFEVALELLLRGHKTTVCYPKYYENYVLESGLSKVDDVFAFKTMLNCGLIEFHEVEKRHKYKWFNVVADIVDQNRAVFVSSVDYDPRKTHTCSYKKESERILSPVFVMLKDVTMIFDASIRYRISDTQFKTIGPDEILHFPDDADEQLVICSQLYLKDQVWQICHMLQLYRLKKLHQWSIRQLLYILVRAKSDIEMPFISEPYYHKLRGFDLN